MWNDQERVVPNSTDYSLYGRLWDYGYDKNWNWAIWTTSLTFLADPILTMAFGRPLEKFWEWKDYSENGNQENKPKRPKWWNYDQRRRAKVDAVDTTTCVGGIDQYGN